jgi:hypothetical protein
MDLVKAPRRADSKVTTRLSVRQVCELREKRLDQEEVVGEMTRAVEALKRDKEALAKKEKIIDGALKQVLTRAWQATHPEVSQIRRC